jgi:hypothetical protein
LDVVHNPHAKQSSAIEEAHYMFDLPNKVATDATALLNNLKSTKFALEGGSLQVAGAVFGGVGLGQASA